MKIPRDEKKHYHVFCNDVLVGEVWTDSWGQAIDMISEGAEWSAEEELPE